MLACVSRSSNFFTQTRYLRKMLILNRESRYYFDCKVEDGAWKTGAYAACNTHDPIANEYLTAQNTSMLKSVDDETFDACQELEVSEMQMNTAHDGK